jgi:alpha-tubulin suppressor-like RCC1 family protein
MGDGTVKCWGFGKDGELGNGAFANSATPVEVTGIHDALAIVPGGYTRCALLQGGDVACWGENSYGEIENPPSSSLSGIATPVTVARLKGAKAISVAYKQLCAVLEDSTVACSGAPDDPSQTSPWVLQGFSGATSIAIATYRGCVLASDGTVSCWGFDVDGELGNGTVSSTNTETATPVTGLRDVTALTAGDYFTCALTGGTVWCWGGDNVGELGSGPYACAGENGGSCSPVPIAVPGLGDAIAIAAGGPFACALRRQGTVECWGDDIDSELGDGMRRPASYAPVPVKGLSGVTGISASGYHACAVLASGSVACWGSDAYGELGAPAPQTCGTAPCSMNPIYVSF